jgi:hypothetical protein
MTRWLRAVFSYPSTEATILTLFSIWNNELNEAELEFAVLWFSHFERLGAYPEQGDSNPHTHTLFKIRFKLSSMLE